MEKRTEIEPRFSEAGNLTSKQSESVTTTGQKKIDFTVSPTPGIKSINLSGDKLIITAELSGVFCQGIQYYDLKNILFINNTGMANLIDLLKSLLKQGVEVRFVNVCEKIKEKIKSMGLENVLHCS